MKYTFILSVILLLSSCSGIKTTPPSVSNAEIAAESDIQRKLIIKKEVKSKTRKMKLRLKQQEKLNRIASLILEGGIDICTKISKSEKCVYDFILLEDGGTTAYTDGKTIYITPTMMKSFPSDEELAIIIGHEYAHNIMKHSAKKSTNNIVGSVIGALLDGVAASQGINTGLGFSKSGGNIATLVHFHNFEKEADYVGLYVTASAGFNIENSADLWRKMSGKFPKGLSGSISHPSNPERFVALRKTIEEITNKRKNNIALFPELKLN